MKLSKFFVIVLVVLFSNKTWAQDAEIKLDANKVQKFTPYLEHNHGGPKAFVNWKENNKMQYAKEMWYYSESFYVKRNYLNEGATLNEEIIPIDRFENNRKENEEAIVMLPGFKDVLVLLPKSKCIYIPNK